VIANFLVAPGDELVVWVWLDSGGANTCAGFLNESQQTSTALCGQNPLPVYGSSLEWIVERPDDGFGLRPLANYVAIPLWHSYGWDNATGATLGTISKPPSNFGSTGGWADIAMTDDSSSSIISQRTTLGPQAAMFNTMGSGYCAAGASCQPRQ